MADKFFRKQTREAEEVLFAEAKKDIKVEIKEDLREPIDPGEDFVNEMIEYDDTVEALDDDDDDDFWGEDHKSDFDLPKTFVVSKPKVAIHKPKGPPRTYLPRRLDGNRQNNQCHCGVFFSTKRRLQNHVRVRHEVVPEDEKLACDVCGRKFKIQEYLDHHKKNMHTNSIKQRERHPCSICGNILSSVTALKNHEEKHLLETMTPEEIKKISCDLCGMRFRLKCYLFNHMHNAHIRQKYICPFCKKGFYKKHEIEDHIRQHTLENPFKCEFEGCGKSFHRKKNLLVHRVSNG